MKSFKVAFIKKANKIKINGLRESTSPQNVVNILMESFYFINLMQIAMITRTCSLREPTQKNDIVLIFKFYFFLICKINIHIHKSFIVDAYTRENLHKKKIIFPFVELIPKFYKKLKMAEQRDAKLSEETKRRIFEKFRKVRCSRYGIQFIMQKIYMFLQRLDSDVANGER